MTLHCAHPTRAIISSAFSEAAGMVSIARIERPLLYRGALRARRPCQPSRHFPFQAACFSLSKRHPCLVLLRPSSDFLAMLHPSLLVYVTSRGEDAEPHLRASNEGLPRPRVARATEVGVLIPPPSSLGFRRRPVHLRVSAAVEAGEPVAGFTAGIRHGRKGDGGVVIGAAGLIV